MRMRKIRTTATAVTLAFSLAAGGSFATAASASGTVKVGLSTALSGAVASLGQTGQNGVALAIQHINANGGLLGKKVQLVSADSETTPATGVTNVRNFILKDQVKAIFGPVSSAVGAAEGQTAAQYHVPIFFFVSNDVDQTGKYFSKYAFQVVPSTYMEPHGVAAYVAKKAEKQGWKTYYTISPNYSFGRSTVKEFLAGMKEYGANLDVAGQQWPKLGASDFTQYLSATMSKNPDFVFIGQYGGDLVTLTKQAEGYNFFHKTPAYAGYWLGALEALGAKAPAGVVTSDRAPPFYATHTKAMQQLTKAYHSKYDGWPTSWAIMGYSAVETWAHGVKKAGSFDADKVSSALSGAKVDTVRGAFKLRACDHLAQIPEYIGVLSKKVNSKYGIRTMTDVYKAPPEKIMLSCQKKKAMRNS